MTLADASTDATPKRFGPLHVAHVTLTDVIAWTVERAMRPDRAGVAIEAFLIGLLILNDRAFLYRLSIIEPGPFLYAVMFVVLIVLDVQRGTVRNTIVHAWNVRVRYKRLTHGNKNLPAVRAVLRETAITPHQRTNAWLETTSERIGITPPLRLDKRGSDALGDLLDVRVPVGPAMNPAVLSTKGYRDRIRACVQGDCYDVHVWPNDKRGGIAHIRIVRTDIRSVTAGPSPLIATPPTSIVQPVQIGMSAMREPVLVDLMARSGVGVFGMNGTGKSVLLHTFLCHVGQCGDANEALGDMKDGMDGAPYRNTITYSEDPDEVHEWIARWCTPKAMSGKAVETWRRSELAMERSKQLQDMGLEKWHPSCGMPAEFIIIDEVDNITPNDQFALAWAINKLRAIGVRVIIASQLPRADTLDRRLTVALNLRISFRVADVDAATSALGKGAVGRGFDASTLPVPGFCYVLGSDQQDPMIVRTHLLDVPAVKQLVARFPKRATVEGYAPKSDSYADLTVSPAPMEGSAETGLTPSDRPVEPPADAPAGTKKRAMWDAMPGQRGDLARAAGFTPEHASAVLKKWAAEGKAISVGNVWRHRQPLRAVEDLA